MIIKFLDKIKSIKDTKIIDKIQKIFQIDENQPRDSFKYFEKSLAEILQSRKLEKDSNLRSQDIDLAKKFRSQELRKVNYSDHQILQYDMHEFLLERLKYSLSSNTEDILKIMVNFYLSSLILEKKSNQSLNQSQLEVYSLLNNQVGSMSHFQVLFLKHINSLLQKQQHILTSTISSQLLLGKISDIIHTVIGSDQEL